MKKFLSIVIPTYNRAQTLSLSLLSITSQPIFSACDDIEIVISDNASTDNTPNVVSEFMKLYPNKIYYFRNTENVKDENFELAMRRSNGEYIKLANDTLMWIPGSLEGLYRLTQSNREQQPFIFFANGSLSDINEPVAVNKLDTFLSLISYHVTWIGAFGLWKNQLNKVNDFSKFANLQLAQVYVALGLVESEKKAFISNQVFFHILTPPGRKSYNLSKVFGKNFLHILNLFKENISQDVYSMVKKDTLINHILPYHYDPDQDFGLYPLEDDLDDYYHETYYSDAIRDARNASSHYVNKLNPHTLNDDWRGKNQHNSTYLTKLCDIRRVSVGNETYGPLNVLGWGAANERLIIGNYVSIGETVTFLMGGNHSYSGATTFPLKVKFMNYVNEATSKGPIIIGDDVWIGYGSTILSGVKVGQGAVIGASAVVASDVPPYAIVAGNPAKIIKYRFEESVIDELITIDYSILKPQDVVELSRAFNANDLTSTKEIIKNYKKTN